MSNASEDRDVLAGEYVVGALEPHEAQAVEAMADGDPLLAAAITKWQDRLAPLAKLVRPVDPPEALWTRLEEAIAPVVLAMPTAEQRRLRGVWRNAGVWRGATVGSLALAAGFAGLAFVHNPAAPTAAKPIYVAELAPTGEPSRSTVAVAQSAAAPAEPGSTLTQTAGDDAGQSAAERLQQAAAQQPPGPGAAGSSLERVPPATGSTQPAAAPGFIVVTLPDGSLVVKPTASVQAPAGKDLQLWAEPSGAATPTSLGILPAGGLHVATHGAMEPSTKLMISLEPQGGTLGGQPTGPVLYSGTLSRAE